MYVTATSRCPRQISARPAEAHAMAGGHELLCGDAGRARGGGDPEEPAPDPCVAAAFSMKLRMTRGDPSPPCLTDSTPSFLSLRTERFRTTHSKASDAYSSSRSAAACRRSPSNRISGALFQCPNPIARAEPCSLARCQNVVCSCSVDMGRNFVQTFCRSGGAWKP